MNVRLLKLHLLVVVALVAGCGKSGPQIAPVSGRITVDGRPMQNVDIVFQPDGSVPPSAGRTDKDGHYELGYKRGLMGGRVGQNTVRISISSELMRKPPKIAPEYNSDSKLRKEVKPGQNTFDFDVTTVSAR